MNPFSPITPKIIEWTHFTVYLILDEMGFMEISVTREVSGAIAFSP
jgi:hypothetical protein